MNFYAYIPRPDGSAPLGTGDRFIIRDLKTIGGVVKRLKGIDRWNQSGFIVQTFTNFYDDKTFKTVFTHKPLTIAS